MEQVQTSASAASAGVFRMGGFGFTAGGATSQGEDRQQDQEAINDCFLAGFSKHWKVFQ